MQTERPSPRAPSPAPRNRITGDRGPGPPVPGPHVPGTRVPGTRVPGNRVSGNRITAPRELLAATAVLVVLLGAFLWTPIVTGGAYAPADLIQSSPLVRTVPDDYRFGNVLLTDPVLQMYPWLEFSKVNLLEGDLPVWNPYNGAGAPLLGNYVSAVLSPFSAPFYALGWQAALLVSAGLKLLVAGVFTYLFLRRVAIAHLPSVVGAAAYMFAAYNVLWLSWPHPGAAVCLPAGLYFAELAIQGRSRPRARLAWCGYVAAVLVGFLAGHPETLFFAWGLVLVYVPVRLLVSRGLGDRRVRLLKGGQFAVASVLAAALASVQLMPFLEYLGQSTAYETGGERAQPRLELDYSALHAFPNLFGAPSEDYHAPDQLVGNLVLPDGTRLVSNYNEAAGYYVGLLVLLLAAVGIVGALRRRHIPGTILAVAATAWFLYLHDVGGVGHVLGRLPLLELNAVNRGHPIWAFSAACLAAMGVEAVTRMSGSRQRWAGAGALAAAGTAMAGGFALLTRTTLVAGGNLAGEVVDPVGRASVHAHQRFVVLTYLAGVGGLVLLAGLGDRPQRRLAATGLVLAMVFAQSGYLLRSHNPTVDPSLVMATSPGLEAVKTAAGPLEDTASLGRFLAADANLGYRVRTPDNYDGLGVARYDQLRRDVAGMPDDLRGRRALEVTGARLVASESAYPTALPASPALGPPFAFTSLADGVHALTVAVEPPAEGDCRLSVELVDADGGAVVATAAAGCVEPFTTLSFAPVAGSGGRSYVARFGGTARPTAAVPWWGGVAGMEQVPANDRVALFRVPTSPGRYFSPGSARPVASDEEARQVMTSPEFDMGATVLVHGTGVEAADASPGTVEVLQQRATEVRLRVDRDSPGWLVAVQTWYPGWEATVNGFPTELRRADYAFMAVPVDEGESEVVLRYRPRSVLLGVVVSALALVALVMWTATARPGAPGERRGRIPWGPPRPPLPKDGSPVQESRT